MPRLATHTAVTWAARVLWHYRSMSTRYAFPTRRPLLTAIVYLGMSALVLHAQSASAKRAAVQTE
ncbi:MAG TPA: hypothetical protein VES20_20905, partial [Bryobacteraceae bacterium]|nr:hypothetical protein [Bryobacteraceae bacterium]